MSKMNSKFRIQQRIKEHSTRRRLFESKSLGRIGTSLRSSWLAHAIRQHTRLRPRDDVLLLNHPMSLEWVFRFWLSLGGFICHPEARMPTGLDGNRALITKNDIGKCVATLQNGLRATLAASLCWHHKSAGNRRYAVEPALLPSQSSYCGRTHGNS